MDFILNELKEHDNDAKTIWKVIHKVIPSDKFSCNADIMLKDEGVQVAKDEVAHYINHYFINVGCIATLAWRRTIRVCMMYYAAMCMVLR